MSAYKQRTVVAPRLVFAAIGLGGLCLIFALLASSSPALGQEVVCDSLSDFPCGNQMEQVGLRRAPALFKLEARVAQAGGMMLGTAELASVVVQLVSGTDLCEENFSKVLVTNSVVNLEIGREMDCDLDEFLATHGNVEMNLCIGTSNTCLPPIKLRSVPYGIRATYASTAGTAHVVNRAGQASYVHRLSADSQALGVSNMLGHGYFDFETPSAEAVAPLYDEQEFETYKDGGFLLWTPVRNRSASNLHVLAQESGGTWLRALDQLVLASRQTRAKGALKIETLTPQGVVVTGRGVHVAGDSVVAGDFTAKKQLGVVGSMYAGGVEELNDSESGQFTGTLLVGNGVEMLNGGLMVTNDALVHGTLTITAPDVVTIEGSVSASGPNTIIGLLQGPEALVTGTLNSPGTVSAQSLNVGGNSVLGNLDAGELVVNAGGTVGGKLTVTGNLDVTKDVLIAGDVTFLGGSSIPGVPADTRYIQYENENRDISFGGHVSLEDAVTAGEVLVGAFNQLLNTRLQAATEPPVACGEQGTQGFIYLDTEVEALRVCRQDQWYELTVAADLCGNGFIREAEECDDGNSADGDGCSSSCEVEDGYACDGEPSNCTN
jgi:cysteine-rich repeat protein